MLTTFQHATDIAMAEVLEEMSIRKTLELFLLFSLGSQYDHLIAQGLAKLGVFCLVADPATVTAEDVARLMPIGIILSGGPASVWAEPPPFDSKILDLGIPVLGICLGFQLWAKHIGANVVAGTNKEYGRHAMVIDDTSSPLFYRCRPDPFVIQNHGDMIEPHPLLALLSHTANAPVGAANFRHLWGVQFHPEVSHTDDGLQMLENFCFQICQATDRYPAEQEAQRKIREIRDTVGDGKILLALSGGSDSSVVAFLIKEAIESKPGKVRAVYIKGIDRADDEAFVLDLAKAEASWLELVVVDATELFLKALHGKFSMHEKRLAMQGIYKQILEEQAALFGANFIAQGTLYTDISESGGGYTTGARKAQIKLHHNINVGFSLPELTPIADCVKDSARNIGREVQVPEELLIRHPFPGPGMVIRVEGEITAEKLQMARHVDEIFIGELRRANYYNAVWQAGAAVTQSVHTYSKGEDAGDGPLIVLWAVYSVNGFTAQRARFDHDFLDRVTQRITNEVPKIGYVSFGTSSKPPATIEWG